MLDPPYPPRLRQLVDEIDAVFDLTQDCPACGPAQSRAVAILEDLQEYLEELEAADDQRFVREVVAQVVGQVAVKLIAAMLDTYICVAPHVWWRSHTWAATS